MRKIKVFALLSLLAVSPVLLGAGSGGFPSKPTFKGMTVENQKSPMGAIDYYTGIKVRQSNTTIGSGTANTTNAFNYALDDNDGTGLAFYLNSNTTATIGFWADHWNQGADGCQLSDPGCGLGVGAWFANNNCVFLLQSEGDNTAIGKFSIYGNRSGLCNASLGGYFAPVELLKLDNFTLTPILTMFGDMAYSGTLNRTTACATGYTRRSPNYCSVNADPAQIVLVRDTCTTVARPSANAKEIQVHLRANAVLANAVGQRTSLIEFFTTNTCATRLRMGARSIFYELTASAAALAADEDTNSVRVPVDGSGNIFVRVSDDATDTGTGVYAFEGYFE